MGEIFVHLFHIVIASGILFYIGVTRDRLPSVLFPIILGLGLLIVGYHVYKASLKRDAWVNYIHIFIVGPLLVWVGFQRAKTPRKIFELILMLAFASLGYHGYYLLRR